MCVTFHDSLYCCTSIQRHGFRHRPWMAKEMLKNEVEWSSFSVGDLAMLGLHTSVKVAHSCAVSPRKVQGLPCLPLKSSRKSHEGQQATPGNEQRLRRARPLRVSEV